LEGKVLRLEGAEEETSPSRYFVPRYIGGLGGDGNPRGGREGGAAVEYFESPVRKDQRARAIADRDGITEGLVCVFATIEACRSFRLAYGHRRPTIRPAWRKCLFLYFNFLDREFGFCHARVQTWFPFTMQVYVNGHEWLTRQMDERGLGYRRLDAPSSGSRISDACSGRASGGRGERPGAVMSPFPRLCHRSHGCLADDRLGL
jgi:hypothetical protein